MNRKSGSIDAGLGGNTMNRRRRRYEARSSRDPWELLRKVKVVSEVEAELVDAVVCMPLPDPMHFPDNKTGVCSRCGIGIYFRPHVPVLPPKLCIHCAAAMAEEEKKKEEAEQKKEQGQEPTA
jgi:hypothetical protein